MNKIEVGIVFINTVVGVAVFKVICVVFNRVVLLAVDEEVNDVVNKFVNSDVVEEYILVVPNVVIGAIEGVVFLSFQ